MAAHHPKSSTPARSYPTPSPRTPRPNRSSPFPRPRSQDPTAPASPPAPTQVSQILKPLRTPSQRHLAAHPGQIGTLWLRTCYAPDTSEQHSDLISPVDLDNAIDGPAYLLSDPTLYDFGPDWPRILDIFPELVGLPDRPAQLAHQARIQAAIAAFHAARTALASTDPSVIPGAPTALIEGAREFLPAQNVTPHVLTAMQSSIHKACVVNYLLVEDALALESGELRLLFLDARGRVVREARVDGSAAEEMGGFWLQRSWDEVGEWTRAEWGESYREGGAEGALLLFQAGS